MKKIITVVGARPQFIKAAALSSRLNNEENINEIIIHTGQHYDQNMSDIFWSELNIPQPKYRLNIGSGSHSVQTGKMLIELDPILQNEKPDAVLVYGDTNSTLAGSLSASKLHIPVFHVEAGLRSFNKKMPEEINRIITDHLSSLLFCPTINAKNNLYNENCDDNAYITGDIMFDMLNLMSNMKCDILQKNKIEGEKYYLCTIHRAENTDSIQNLRSILEALSNLNEKIILPIHPRLKKILNENKITFHENVKVIDPVSYLEMITLEKHAFKIITDSGGVQKEAFFFKIPCVTLREETEWTETVEQGWNIITGTNTNKIIEAIQSKGTPEKQLPVYGDGNASNRIVDLINIFFQ